jgi:hypothetical protein
MFTKVFHELRSRAFVLECQYREIVLEKYGNRQSSVPDDLPCNCTKFKVGQEREVISSMVLMMPLHSQAIFRGIADGQSNLSSTLSDGYDKM